MEGYGCGRLVIQLVDIKGPITRMVKVLRRRMPVGWLTCERGDFKGINRGWHVGERWGSSMKVIWDSRSVCKDVEWR